MNKQMITRHLSHHKRLLSSTAAALALFIAQAHTAYAQGNPNTSNSNTASPGSTTVPAPPAPVSTQQQLPDIRGVQIAGISKLGETKSPDDKTPVQAGIRDIIVLKVAGLDKLVQVANCKDTNDRPVQPCQQQKIALFLDGREIKGLQPESGAPNTEEGTLQFHLDRSADSDEAWADLLGAPPLKDPIFYYRPTEVSIGFANGYAFPIDRIQNPVRFELIRIHKSWFIVCTILLLIVLLLLFWLALNSEILRDIGPVPEGFKKGWVFTKKIHKPYSLARFQMAVWFVLVIAAFLYIWMITGAWDTITASTLALIGIGAGTAIGAAAIDLGKDQTNRGQLEQIKAEKVTLESDIAALDTQINATAAGPDRNQMEKTRSDKQTRLNLVNSQIDSLSSAVGPKQSNGFLNDILTDGDNGISFHRFQMFVWTIVAGILFIYSVYSRLSMPDFSATLLALMGISSGTYIGFKIPEAQS
ncbi:MAG TPA: hypothetical protein VNN73_14080 [Blastocatellia bacterium]|nr:hypothetical protein [Blastocatellia bacterium]